MRKFGAYPISVNYNLHTHLRSDGKEDELLRAGRAVEARELFIKTTTTSDSKLENNMWKQEMDQYEKTICEFLRKIEGNPVGRMVLNLINKETRVWIIPKSEKEMKQFYGALTFPLHYEIQKGSVTRGVGSGDTVIQFMPDLGDDTLLHELVHAYRYSYDKFNPLNVYYSTQYASFTITSEEVLAHQIENIYMSQGRRPLTLDYKTLAAAEKKEIYDFLTANYFLLQALKFFLRHEYLAMLAAHTFTSTDYNPFRDYAALEAEYLKGALMPTLPELGTPLGR